MTFQASFKPTGGFRKKGTPREILIVCLVCNFAQLLPVTLSKRLKRFGTNVEKKSFYCKNF